MGVMDIFLEQHNSNVGNKVQPINFENKGNNTTYLLVFQRRVPLHDMSHKLKSDNHTI